MPDYELLLYFIYPVVDSSAISVQPSEAAFPDSDLENVALFWSRPQGRSLVMLKTERHRI